MKKPSPRQLLPLLLLMIAAGRMHGIGGVSWFRITSTIIITAAMTYAGFFLWGWWAIPLAIGPAYGISTGHGRFFAMNGANINDTNPEAIERYFALWFWQKVLKRDITERAYSWLCMAIKGVMIGLPILPLGLVLALYWPASYQFSMRVTNSTALAEWLSTTFAGIAMWYIVLYL